MIWHLVKVKEYIFTRKADNNEWNSFFIKAFLQEDPATFCKFLSSEEALKEYTDVAKIVDSPIPPIGSGYEDFRQIVSAMKILAAIKIQKCTSEKMSSYLSERVHREKISAKILCQKWSKENFDPLMENLAVQNLLFDLLVIFFFFNEKTTKNSS